MATFKSRRQRGFTLTTIAFVSGMMLLAMGTVFLSGSEQAYRLSMLREREAKLLAAADAGIAEGVARWKANRAALNEPQRFTLERDGANVEVSAVPGAATAITSRATSGTGDLALERTLVARVDFSGDSPRVIEVSRQ